MTMDSKAVARALKKRVFPGLKDAGFSEFSSRAAWRRTDRTTAVIGFPSLGSYLGSAIGTTSHSFGASAGVYYRALHEAPWSTDPMPARPEESRCQARRSLSKSIRQFWCRRPDIWYVNRRGSNLDAVVADVLRAVRQQALPWLAEFEDQSLALAAFEAREDSEMQPGILLETLGGGLDSLARAEISSTLALAGGDVNRAREAWQRLVANPYYQRIPDVMRTAEERLSLIGPAT